MFSNFPQFRKILKAVETFKVHMTQNFIFACSKELLK